MEQGFIDALLSSERSPLIPEERDYWGDLIGSWELDYVENRGTEREKHVRGEWHFARVLEGLGIEDIFICPARDACEKPHEYGATIRMYNPKSGNWDMVYTCRETMSRFTGTRDGDRIVLTNIHNKRSRWVFTDIRPDSFHWQNETTLRDGTLKIWCEVFGTRAHCAQEPTRGNHIEHQ